MDALRQFNPASATPLSVFLFSFKMAPLCTTSRLESTGLLLSEFLGTPPVHAIASCLTTSNPSSSSTPGASRTATSKSSCRFISSAGGGSESMSALRPLASSGQARVSGSAQARSSLARSPPSLRLASWVRDRATWRRPRQALVSAASTPQRPTRGDFQHCEHGNAIQGLMVDSFPHTCLKYGLNDR